MIRRAVSFLPVLFVACSAANEQADVAEAPFSSNQATLLDFEFDGELVTDSAWNTDKAVIQDQLLYTMGHLNGDEAVGRLDKVTLTAVTRTQEGEKTRIKYHAKLPVAWGTKTNLPTTYAFTLPTDVSQAALESFTEAYSHTCVDFGAHEVDTGSMWYYFRPHRSGCSIDPSLVKTSTATITRSTENTAGKYPEYQKVWEDDALNVVAIFGKYEDGASTSSDAGISAFNSFVASMRRELPGATTTPASIPTAPGVSAPDVSFQKTLPDGKKVSITALLVDNISSTSAEFDTRYNALSTRADIIAYNGHAGLGQNVRALARKGTFTAGQYQIIFMNGCDTFSYVDGSLAQTRARLNPDDPTGTKYMEFVTNAMPAFFASMSGASTSLIKGLLAYNTPKTYDQIFSSIDTSQIVVVTGEEDNVFAPGMPIGSGSVTPNPIPPGFAFALDGTPAKNQEVRASAGRVEAGSYTFTMTGTGDADLYVKSGAAVSTTTYDCRPYKNGTAETCTVTLTAPAEVNIMVRGYAASSTFAVTGKKN